MEEYEKISVESINSLLSNKSKEKNKLNNDEGNISNTKEQNDFIYNIDDILRNENNKNYSNNSISLDYYYPIVKDKDDNIANINISNYITYFKNSNIDKDEIKRIISFNNYRATNLNYNSLNENKFIKYSKSNNSEKEKKSEEEKGKEKEEEKVKRKKEENEKKKEEEKEKEEEIETEIEIENEKEVEIEIEKEKEKQKIYNELEIQINNIKNNKKENNDYYNKNIFERNKRILNLLSKINDIHTINTIIIKKDNSYLKLFTQIIQKLNNCFNNKNNFDTINLLTDIKEKMNINIYLNNQYKKLLKNKNGNSSIINERKKIEYKDNLKLYNDLSVKISKMEKNLKKLDEKLKKYKEFHENNYKNIKEYEEYKIKKGLKEYDNTIKKLEEEIKIKKNELKDNNSNEK